MSTKELQESIVKNMRNWQTIEHKAVAQTAAIMESTDNPVIRAIMEIIQHDSQNHYRVQDLVARSLSETTITLTPDDLEKVWDEIEKHIQLEKKTIELAKDALDKIAGKKMVIQEYLLNYLNVDEEKHNKLLDQLEAIKKGMYPYG